MSHVTILKTPSTLILYSDSFPYGMQDESLYTAEFPDINAPFR